MDSFISGLSGEGRSDSEGSFTLDVRKALKKLERFQLRSEQHYLAKLLQAAYCLDATEIHIDLGVRSLDFSFKFEWDPTVDVLPLAEGLGGIKKLGSPAARHLALALRSAGGRVRWQLAKNRFLEVGEDRVALDQSGTFLGRAIFQVLRQSWWEGFKRVWRRSDEHLFLYEALRFYPKPVYLDGRQIYRHNWLRKIKPGGLWYGYRSMPYYLLEAYFGSSLELPSIGAAAARWEGFSADGPEGFYRNDRIKESGRGLVTDLRNVGFQFQVPTLYKWTERVHHYGVALALPLEMKGPARVHFLLDGVLSDGVSVELGCPGLLCVVSGEGLEVDMSEFQVVQNLEYRQRLTVLQEVVDRFLRLLLARRYRYGALLNPEEDANERKLSFMEERIQSVMEELEPTRLFDHDWRKRFGFLIPLGHRLRDGLGKHRWLRIHSLQDSQRYPTSDSEWETLFKRHREVAAAILEDGEAWLVWVQLERQSPPSGSWYLSRNTYIDIRFWFRRVSWPLEEFEELLRGVAEDESRFLLVSQRKNRIYAPYDGGADLFLESPKDQAAFRKRFQGWLSKRKDGL